MAQVFVCQGGDSARGSVTIEAGRGRLMLRHALERVHPLRTHISCPVDGRVGDVLARADLEGHRVLTEVGHASGTQFAVASSTEELRLHAVLGA